jgi:hypothetical protein
LKAQEKIDNYFLSLQEPERSCLLFLHSFLLTYSTDISTKRSFNTPFYYYKGKSICFISYHPETKVIYISFTNGFLIDHPDLVSEGRKKQKILYIDPSKDIDVESLSRILELACAL